MDAEETWITDPLDALCNADDGFFQQRKPIIYNTAQMYRHDRLQFVKDCYETVSERIYFCHQISEGVYGKGKRKSCRTQLSFTHSAE